jgi:hypothetical protein
VVLGYLIERERMTLKEAYALVTAVRPRIAVHEGYFKQLQELEKSCFGEISLHQEDIGPSVQQLIRDLRGETQSEE